MKKLNVAFDIDETLVEIIPTVDKLLYKMYNAKLLPVTQYEFETEPKISTAEFWSLFGRMYEKFEETKPFHGARELLWELHQLTGDPIKLVTARPTWAHKKTHEMLQEFFNVPYELCIGAGDDKGSFLKGIDCFVEDRRRTAIELAEAGKHVFVPVKTYNQGIEHKNVTYIRNINVLRGHLDWLVK